jgi:hypothetical protein
MQMPATDAGPTFPAATLNIITQIFSPVLHFYLTGYRPGLHENGGHGPPYKRVSQSQFTVDILATGITIAENNGLEGFCQG